MPQEDVHGAGQVSVGLSSSGVPQNSTFGVIRLVLLDETVGEFVDTKPVPGLTFGWGPEGSGSIVYTDRDGQLLLLDQKKHKQAVASDEGRAAARMVQ